MPVFLRCAATLAYGLGISVPVRVSGPSVPVTVEPGATVSLAVFTIMSPVLTGATAADNTVHPTLVESTIATIQADLRSDGQYFTGMTQAQIDSLANF